MDKSGWIFKEEDIFGPKNAKIQTLHKIYCLDFFEILCDVWHSEGSKSQFFSDFRTTLIKESHFGRSWIQN